MKHIAIVGFGRFGELLADLLAPDYTVAVVESDPARRAAATGKGYNAIALQDIAASDTVVFAVPISAIEQVVAEAAPFITPQHVAMDICSVKVHPSNVLRKHVPQAQIIATHPMFGPDSASKGLAGLQVALCPLTASEATVAEVAAAWKRLGLEVVMTTPEQHDQDAVLSQSFTYSVAKIILNMHLPAVNLTTRSYNALTEVARLSANDSEQLFHDMLYYNPYFKSMKAKFTAAMDSTRTLLRSIEDEQNRTQIFDS